MPNYDDIAYRTLADYQATLTTWAAAMTALDAAGAIVSKGEHSLSISDVRNGICVLADRWPAALAALGAEDEVAEHGVARVVLTVRLPHKCHVWTLPDVGSDLYHSAWARLRAKSDPGIAMPARG